MNFKTNVTGFIFISLVGRLGLGAWLLVHVLLGWLADKIRVSIS